MSQSNPQTGSVAQPDDNGNGSPKLVIYRLASHPDLMLMATAMHKLRVKPLEMTTYSWATSTKKKKSETGQQTSYTTLTESDRQTDTFINL